jgi:hypothetical protein
MKKIYIKFIIYKEFSLQIDKFTKDKTWSKCSTPLGKIPVNAVQKPILRYTFVTFLSMNTCNEASIKTK